jgi:hypothetical protein
MRELRLSSDIEERQDDATPRNETTTDERGLAKSSVILHEP